MAGVERGAAELAAVAARLKAAGRGDLKKELARGIRDSTKPTAKKAQAAALAELPHRGGLAAEIAREPIRVRTRLSAGRNGVGVSLFRKRGRNFEERGRLRHPVFGNRDVWVTQQVPSGWFTRTVERDADRIRGGIEGTTRRVARKIEG